MRALTPALIALTLLVLCIVAERTLSPTFKNCIAQEEQNERANTAKDNPAVLSVPIVYARCSGAFVDMHGGGITALATIIIAAFTGTLWFATDRQVRLTEQAFVVDTRAFMAPTSFQQFHERPAPGVYHWRFRPLWENTGKTPTRRLRMYTACEIRNTLLPVDYAFQYPGNEVAPAFVHPGGKLLGSLAPRGGPGMAITPQDILDVQQGRRFLYLWGWMKYFDVFPGTPEHTTHFCWQITINGDPLDYVPNTPGTPPTPHTLLFNYLQTFQGNYAD